MELHSVDTTIHLSSYSISNANVSCLKYAELLIFFNTGKLIISTPPKFCIVNTYHALVTVSVICACLNIGLLLLLKVRTL